MMKVSEVNRDLTTIAQKVRLSKYYRLHMFLSSFRAHLANIENDRDIAEGDISVVLDRLSETSKDSKPKYAQLLTQDFADISAQNKDLRDNDVFIFLSVLMLKCAAKLRKNM